MIRLNKFLVVISIVIYATLARAGQMWDLDFGAGSGPSGKSGFAETGRANTDFWNFYSRDGGSTTLSNLKTVEGTTTTLSINVANAPGAWGLNSSDPMYDSYLYPFSGSATLTVNNLPVGSYDVYIYSPDASFQLSVGGVNQGTKSCNDPAAPGQPSWEEGKNYVRYAGVQVATAGQNVTVTVNAGQSGYATFSGLQIAPACDLQFTSMPTSQTVPEGADANFDVGVSGSGTLYYQWYKNGVAITGKTQSSLFLNSVQQADIGKYSVRVWDGTGQRFSSASSSAEQGPAAVGRQWDDYWNFLNGNWDYYAELDDLVRTDNTSSDVDIIAENFPGFWGNGSSDPMYNGYIYPWEGESGTVTIQHLPIGVYDLYVYGPDGQFQVNSGGVNYGTKSAYDSPVSPLWVSGKQYVRYVAIQVTSASQDVVLTVNPGVGGYATISGLQIVEARPTWDLDFGAGSGPTPKTGYAEIGKGETDFWNFYSRDGGSTTLSNLKTVEGTTTTLSINVANAPGAWGLGSSDPMYDSYLYPFSGSATLTVNNLPVGSYDVYIYSPDASFQLSVGGVNQGTKSCNDPAAPGQPSWEEGRNYVRYAGVQISSAGQNVTATVNAGQSGYATFSGLQIAPACDIDFSLMPTSLTVSEGLSASFGVQASGTGPLSFQWYKNGVAIPGQTRDSLFLSPVQQADSGKYSVRVSNPTGQRFSSVATLIVYKQTIANVWSVDFGAGASSSTEQGPAAVGRNLNDYWNFFNGNWDYYVELDDLLRTDTASTDVDIIAENFPGAWGNGSSDPMYNGYIYPWQGESGTVTIQNLPVGTYDLYVYSPDGQFVVNSGGVNYGTKSANDSPIAPLWTSGKQYVRYEKIEITSAPQDIALTVNPGVSGYATISGLQIVERNDIFTVTISASDPTASETANEPGKFTVSRTSGDWSSDLVVNFQVATGAGSATEGLDYLPIGNNVVIPRLQGSADITITPLTDFLVEGDETVTVNLTSGINYHVGSPSSAIVTITDGEPPRPHVVTIQAATPTACENSGTPGAFAISRTGGILAAPLTVSYAIAAGSTATEGVDFQNLAPHQVTIPANATFTTIPINPVMDGISEGIENVIITLTPGQHYTIGTPNSATVSILDSCDENVSTGTDFWVQFYRTHGPADISLRISGEEATTGSVSIPGLAFNQAFSVTPGTVTTINLPAEVVLIDYDSVQNKGIHVTSQKPISVYGMIYQQFASEAFLAYPTSMLGNNYRVMAWPGLMPEFAQFTSQFAVLATVNNTTVWIAPSATADIDQRPGTTPFPVTLQQGQMYQLRSAGAFGDVTGTLLTSDKPFVVVGGTRCARVPNQNVGYCNHLVEEQLPVPNWGKQALGIPLASREGDTYRILAASDNTVVKINGIQVATLNASQFYDTQLYDPVVFEADKPIQVAQFSNSRTFDGKTADPFMMILPSTGGYLKSYTVSTPVGFIHNYMNLIAEQSALASVTIDGQTLPSTAFFPIGRSAYYGARVEVAPGPHVISSAKAVGVQVYGFAVDDGYGYSGGVSIPTLVAVPDMFDVALNTARTCDVLANDIFANINSVTLSIVTAPPSSQGTVQVTVDKKVTFTPASNFTGDSQFTYQIADGGKVSSATVAVSVNHAPVITTQPRDQTTTVGGSATFSVVAIGNSPLTYQWIHNANVVGTQPTLTLNNVQLADAGGYYAIVSNPGGSVQSDMAVLRVNTDAPTCAIATPANGATVSGAITVRVVGTDDIGTVRALLSVDGVNVPGPAFGGSPYDFTLDTTRLANGTHTLYAQVFDVDGNQCSSQINIQTLNFIQNSVTVNDADVFIAGEGTISFSASFAENANWQFTITSVADGSQAVSTSGTGTSFSQTWDGTGAINTGYYDWQLTAAPADGNGISGGRQTTGRRIRLLGSAPNWDNLASINYHSYGGRLFENDFWYVASAYFLTYTGLAPWAFPLPSEPFIYENRLWETLLGYDGDIVPQFTTGEFMANLHSDNVVYMLTHGYGDPITGTVIFDGHTLPGGILSGFLGTSIAMQLTLTPNPRGFMFVQMNACWSNLYKNAAFNNDIAAGFGILNSPITWRRAYLGWDDKVIIGPATLWAFDQRLWDNLYSGMNILNAVADAYAQHPQLYANPDIDGDISLVLPQLF
jgi:IgGFc binding protein/Bacterial Ig domain/Immunoglobulin I-set domain/Immunoglobulin domain/Calx-beta domain